MGGFRKFDKSRGNDSRGGGRSFGGNSGGGGRKFGGPSDGYRGDGQKPQMHAAVCSECDRDCQVPFRPSGGNPVFCSNCFKKQDSSQSGAPRKSFGGDRGDRGGRSFGGDAGGVSSMSKAQFDVLSMKLDKIMSLLKNVSEFDDEEEEYEEKKPRKFAGPTEQAPVRKSRGKRK